MSITTFSIFCVFLNVFVTVFSNITIPEPEIKVFTPQGFTVTIPHIPGDNYITFNANINRPISQTEIGDLFKVAIKRVKGQWLIDFPDVKLKKGDKIYYRMVVTVHQLHFRKMNEYEVKNFDGDDVPCISTSPTENKTLCEATLNTLTQTLFESQREGSSLRETVDILKSIIGSDPQLSRTLGIQGLSGIKSDDLKMTLESIIQNKLYLSFNVENVTSLPDGTVQFCVKGIEEKLKIIKTSKELLKNSRYHITY